MISILEDNVVVVVFPSIFSQNKIEALITNIKMVLKNQNQKFKKIKKDGKVIIVETTDPVFVSSTINDLFGIKNIAIAKQVKNDFKIIVENITKIAADLFLKNERFLLQVEGYSRGFVTRDVEVAATSSLIEKTVKKGIKPGTTEKYDRRLFVHLTKASAYICIYYDKGLEGIPNNSQNEKMVCCVFDELSAISCIETIKQGFDVKIIVCYNKKSELLDLVKMINVIIHKTIQTQISLEFYKIDTDVKLSPIALTEVVSEILVKVAMSVNIKRISLSISPIIHPISFFEKIIRQIHSKGLISYTPLTTLGEDIIDDAKEIGLEKYLNKIEKIGKTKFFSSVSPKRKIENLVGRSMKTKKTIRVKLDVNNIHDILDSVSAKE
jgi:adenylyl- and sulfurtransferase ThiI